MSSNEPKLMYETGNWQILHMPTVNPPYCYHVSCRRGGFVSMFIHIEGQEDKVVCFGCGAYTTDEGLICMFHLLEADNGSVDHRYKMRQSPERAMEGLSINLEHKKPNKLWRDDA